MKAKKKVIKSKMLEDAHEMAKGLYDAGVIGSTTMREFDVSCLTQLKIYRQKK